MKKWLHDRRDGAVDAIIAYFLPRALLATVGLAILVVPTLEIWVIALVVSSVTLVVLAMHATNEKKIVQLIS